MTRLARGRGANAILAEGAFAVEEIGDTKLERHSRSLLDALARAKEMKDAPAA